MVGSVLDRFRCFVEWERRFAYDWVLERGNGAGVLCILALEEGFRLRVKRGEERCTDSLSSA